MKRAAAAFAVGLLLASASADMSIYRTSRARRATANIATGETTPGANPRIGSPIWALNHSSGYFFSILDYHQPFPYDDVLVIDWGDLDPSAGPIGGFSFEYFGVNPGGSTFTDGRADFIFFGEENGFNSTGRVGLAGFSVIGLPGIDPAPQGYYGWIVTVNLEPNYTFEIVGSDVDGDMLTDFGWSMRLPVGAWPVGTGPMGPSLNFPGYPTDPNDPNWLVHITAPGSESAFDRFLAEVPNEHNSFVYDDTYWFGDPATGAPWAAFSMVLYDLNQTVPTGCPGAGNSGNYCDADIDGSGDCVINLADLAKLLANYGAGNATHDDGDLNGDGNVDLADLAALLAQYGDDCIEVSPCEIILTDTPAGWIPMGRAYGTAVGAPGNDVTYTATVVAGAPRVIGFFLLNTSDEPGICLNYGGESDTDKDLKFRQTASINPAAIFTAPSADGQFIATRGPVTEVTVTVTSYDYGSFGDIIACCFDPNEIDCESYTDPHHIPVDNNNNDVADADFIRDIGPGASSGADDDNDNSPAPGVSDGDGFTRYEEYRGFMLAHAHFRLFPQFKNIVVHDEDGMGLGHFDETGVYAYLCRPEEFNGTASRHVNFKHSSHHIVDQHGLWLRDVDLAGYHNWGLSTGPNGPPVNHDQTQIDLAQIAADSDTDRPAGANNRIPEFNAYVIAHELGHGVSISHHNPTEDGPVDCVLRYMWTDIANASANGAAAWNAMTIPDTYQNAAAGDCHCRDEIDVSDQAPN